MSSSLLQQAIKLLAARDHSVAELRAKLAKYEDDPEAIEDVLARCRDMKYLDDSRFARVFSESLARKGKGQYFIQMELQKRGVDGAIISATLGHLGDEHVRAEEAAHKKLPSLATYPPKEQQLKLVRFLVGRGFSSSVAYQTAHSLVHNSQDEEGE